MVETRSPLRAEDGGESPERDSPASAAPIEPDIPPPEREVLVNPEAAGSEGDPKVGDPPGHLGNTARNCDGSFGRREPGCNPTENL